MLDAALVFELGLESFTDLTVTVRDTFPRCSERLVIRDGISRKLPGEDGNDSWT